MICFLDEATQALVGSLLVRGTGADWACASCNYSSSRKGNVLTHIEGVHLKLSVTCPVCGRDFAKTSFSRHQKSCF